MTTMRTSYDRCAAAHALDVVGELDLYEGSGQKPSPRTMREAFSRGTMKSHEANPEKEARDGARCRLANQTAGYRTRNRGTVQSVILVTGATSKIGRNVVSQLPSTGAAVRTLTRNPDSVGLAGNVYVVRGDLSGPDTPDACLNGVENFLLIWTFFRAVAAPAFLVAVTKYARRIVYLLLEGVGDDLEKQTDTITTKL